MLDSMLFIEYMTVDAVERTSRPMYPLWDHNRVRRIPQTVRTRTNKKIKDLSRGMQMKLMLAVALSHDARLLILDEPTKGIDVGAKAEIYQMVHNLAKRGIGVIFISSELTEVINVCENVIVMYEGRITGRFNRKADTCTEETVLSAAMNDSRKQKV